MTPTHRRLAGPAGHIWGPKSRGSQSIIRFNTRRGPCCLSLAQHAQPHNSGLLSASSSLRARSIDYWTLPGWFLGDVDIDRIPFFSYDGRYREDYGPTMIGALPLGDLTLEIVQFGLFTIAVGHVCNRNMLMPVARLQKRPQVMFLHAVCAAVNAGVASGVQFYGEVVVTFWHRDAPVMIKRRKELRKFEETLRQKTDDGMSRRRLVEVETQSGDVEMGSLLQHGDEPDAPLELATPERATLNDAIAASKEEFRTFEYKDMDARVDSRRRRSRMSGGKSGTAVGDVDAPSFTTYGKALIPSLTYKAIHPDIEHYASLTKFSLYRYASAQKTTALPQTASPALAAMPSGPRLSCHARRMQQHGLVFKFMHNGILTYASSSRSFGYAGLGGGLSWACQLVPGSIARTVAATFIRNIPQISSHARPRLVRTRTDKPSSRLRRPDSISSEIFGCGAPFPECGPQGLYLEDIMVQ
ncbi:hypothetical protein BU16DRAFT_541358 [Lophium mytilinum]|uniref:Uncharacterized protein n=1 Tax=Lophium mytilinum TaxID=390894 RepID=A0A6A6QJD0_9PEZI|nr:hypothetical protein BU16DRAFT_541358 [Lophium mytilinum]